MKRLKFAYTRGALIQCALIQWNEAHWLGWYDCDEDDPPVWCSHGKYRIHPRDAHLEYGPLSSALIEAASWPNVHHVPRASYGAAPADLHEVASCAADLMCWTEDELWRDEQLLDDETWRLWHLFCAEFLADEGL
jgi:hypothetical protein